jgi:uncharacterized protein YndB with AHSA1/START domain
MTVVNVDKDFDNRTMTLTAQFGAPVEQVWELWADPRKLERWWGPPTHPATVTEHALEPGARVRYFMTAPDGQRYHGFWDIDAVAPPTSLAFTDGFADEHGNPSGDMPNSTVQVTLTAADGGTRMEIRSTFDSREQMQQIMDMGAAEGITQSVEQMDALLAG